MSNGRVYNCKNHTNLRWFDTKPGGKLVFMGEIVMSESDTPVALKEPAYEPGNPLIRMRRYVEGKNPYMPSIPLPEPFTYKQFLDYIRYVVEQIDGGFVFECDCSGYDLQPLELETYETVRALPQYEV